MIIFSVYNYTRFRNPFEPGLRYQISSERYNTILRENKIFSFTYIPYNAYYLFINPLIFSSQSPYLFIDREGNSMFFLYPILFTFFFILKVHLSQKQRHFLLISVGVSLFYIFLLLIYFATGWMQFGNRFFLDVTVMLYLSTLFFIKRVPLPLKLVLLLYGVGIHLLGTIIFYTIR